MRTWKESVYSNRNERSDNGVENPLNRVGCILACFHIVEDNKESGAWVNNACFIESITE